MGKRGDWSKRGDWRSRSRWHSDDDWRSGYKGDDKPRYYKRRDDDEYVIIDFEGNNVPQDSTNSLQNILTFDPIYTEDGFELTAQQSPNSVVDPIGVDLADISFDNPFLPELNAAINRVSQSGGRVTGLAGESESDLVIRRAGGKDFEFEGGYFAFAPIIDIPGGLPAGAVPSTNTEASIKLVFEGYKNGFLVDSFESMIPANGYIKSKIDEDIDTLIIKDNDLHGWVVTDNLKFEI
jgi:hypothetical protein